MNHLRIPIIVNGFARDSCLPRESSLLAFAAEFVWRRPSDMAADSCLSGVPGNWLMNGEPHMSTRFLRLSHRFPRRFASWFMGMLLILAFPVLVFVPGFHSPTQRHPSEVKSPIYTIGDAGYELALQEGRRVIKFGPLPWNLYPGGRAFLSLEEAAAFRARQPDPHRWSIYELSGDLERDTHRVGNELFTNKPLVLTEAVVDDGISRN